MSSATRVVGRRCVAFVIDALTVVLVIWIAAQASRDFVDVEGSCPDPVPADHACFEWSGSAYLIDGPSFWRFVVTLVVLLILVRWVARRVLGNPLGKALLGLRVVDAQGRPAGFWRGWVRTLALVVDGIAVILPVGLWLALFTPGHRRLGDFLAGTFVVRARGDQAQRSAGMSVRAG